MIFIISTNRISHFFSFSLPLNLYKYPVGTLFGLTLFSPYILTSMVFSLVIVEDDLDEIALLSIILKKYFPSWKVLFLSEYEEVMNFLTDGSDVSFILLNMHLVVNNGTMIVSEIRQLHWYIQTPIAGYSSAYSVAAVTNFLENGGDYFFEKPYSIDEIVAQLKQLPSLQLNTNKTMKTQTY